ERERITFMIGPPTFFIGLMSAPDFTPAAVASLRLISCGGAGVTPAFVEEASATLGCTVKRTYGSTEAPTVTTTHAGDDPRRGVLTDGRPTGEVELSTDGTTGEVLVRGPELFCGYTDPRRNTEAFTADGWFRTGDTGVLDGHRPAEGHHHPRWREHRRRRGRGDTRSASGRSPCRRGRSAGRPPR